MIRQIQKGDRLMDDITEMIENNAGKPSPKSPGELATAMIDLVSSEEFYKANDPRIKRYHDLKAYKLDVARDGSDTYFNALTEAILAIANGSCGSIDYKGYKIYYTDTPRIKSVSLETGHKEYSYEVSFRCDALNIFNTEEYHSEDERKAYLDPENELFAKTLALLDKELEYLDDGTWIKKKKTLNIYDFKDYSPDDLTFKQIDWDDRVYDASETISYLIDDALIRSKGCTFSEDDFNIFSEVIRRMVYFADYGRRNYLPELQGLIWFEWKPKTKRDLYIWRCMDKFGQGDLPDRLVDSCAIYYFLDDPQGFEALAYLLPITALVEMCREYEPDNVKKTMLDVFDMIGDGGYRDRIEKLIEEDRANAGKGDD